MGAEIHRERGVGFAHLPEHAAEEQGRRAESPVFLGDVESHHAQFVHAGANVVPETAVAVEPGGVHRGGRPRAKGIEDGREVLPFRGCELRKGKDEVLAQSRPGKRRG